MSSSAVRLPRASSSSGVHPCVVLPHAPESGPGLTIPQDRGEPMSRTSNSPTAIWRSAHEAAGVTYGMTAKTLGISARFAQLAGSDGSGKVANLAHVLDGGASLCRAVGRALEAAGAEGLRPARSLDDAALGIALAAADLQRAVRAGEGIGAAAHALDDARLVFRATLEAGR